MPQPRYFKAWILFFLIATVGGAILGGVAGGVLGVVLGFARVDLGTIKIVGGVAGFIISVPVSFFTFRWAVSEYVIKELTRMPPVIPTSPPASPGSDATNRSPLTTP